MWKKQHNPQPKGGEQPHLFITKQLFLDTEDIRSVVEQSR